MKPSTAPLAAPAIGIEFVAMRSNVGKLDDLVAMAKDLNVPRLLVCNVLPYPEELRECCDLRKQNQGWWGWNPSCADCL